MGLTATSFAKPLGMLEGLLPRGGPTMGQILSRGGAAIDNFPRMFGYEWAIGPEADGSVVLGANRLLQTDMCLAKCR